MKLAVQDILIPFFDIIIILPPITLVSNSGWFFFALLNEPMLYLVTVPFLKILIANILLKVTNAIKALI